MRRSGPLLAVGCGLVLLFWGLIALQGIFVRERNDARAALDSQRAALDAYATRAAAQLLRRHLDDTRPLIRDAAADEKASDAGLFLRQDGRLILPRDPEAVSLVVPSNLATPVLLDRRLYLEAKGPRVEGMVVDVDGIVSEVASEMRDAALLQPADHLQEQTGPLPRGTGLASLAAVTGIPLPLSVASPRWAAVEGSIASRFAVKRALGILLGVLALGTVALGLILVRREDRLARLRSDFVAGVSHELRTPLASIRLMAETLQKRTASDYPSRIIAEADRLGFLVENVLSFSRLERGGWSAHPTDVALPDLLGSLTPALACHARVPVEIDHSGAAGEVLLGDPDLLRLLFLNLGSNACKYNAQPTVRIRIDAGRSPAARGSLRSQRKPGKDSANTVIAFEDNGTGIAPGEWDTVFGEFVRGSTGSGFGLGLAICRRVMELHGGAIRVASSGPSGTRFEMTFPGFRCEPGEPRAAGKRPGET